MADLQPLSLPLFAATTSAEQPIVVAARRLLYQCLEAAGSSTRVELTSWDGVRSDFLGPSETSTLPQELRARGIVPQDFPGYCGPLYQDGPKIVVLSLLADVVQPALRHRRENYRFVTLSAWQRRWTAAQRQWVQDQFVEEPVLDHATAAQNWRRILAGVQQNPDARIFLCNVFRHVPDQPAYCRGATEGLAERIRRFNLLAIELSQETGLFLVDLDRTLAQHGARELQTDYRLGGPAAAAVGAQVLVWTLLKAGLDEFLPPELQTEALANLEARIAFGFFQQHAAPQPLPQVEAQNDD